MSGGAWAGCHPCGLVAFPSSGLATSSMLATAAPVPQGLGFTLEGPQWSLVQGRFPPDPHCPFCCQVPPPRPPCAPAKSPHLHVPPEFPATWPSWHRLPLPTAPPVFPGRPSVFHSRPVGEQQLPSWGAPPPAPTRRRCSARVSSGSADLRTRQPPRSPLSRRLRRGGKRMSGKPNHDPSTKPPTA